MRGSWASKLISELRSNLNLRPSYYALICVSRNTSHIICWSDCDYFWHFCSHRFFYVPHDEKMIPDLKFKINFAPKHNYSRLHDIKSRKARHWQDANCKLSKNMTFILLLTGNIYQSSLKKNLGNPPNDSPNSILRQCVIYRPAPMCSCQTVP